MTTNATKESSLNVAAKEGDVPRVQALLHGSSVSPARASAALLAAAKHGHAEVVQLLLAAGADVNTVSESADSPDETPLYMACTGGHSKVVEVLLAAGADTEMGRYVATPLMCIANVISNREAKQRQRRHPQFSIDAYVDVGMQLLRGGIANLETRNEDEMSPLMTLCLDRNRGAPATQPPDNFEMARLKFTASLLAAGADLAAVDNDGWTAVYHACMGGRVDMLSLLLEADSDDIVNVAARDGTTPLHLAAVRQLPEHMTALIAAGANIEAMDAVGNTPLHAASKNARWSGDHTYVYSEAEAVKLLLAAGASVRAGNREGYTPLHVASTASVVKCLLEAGADIEATSIDASGGLDWTWVKGRTPLLAACASKPLCPEVIDELLENGADVHKSDASSRQAVSSAIQRCNMSRSISDWDTALVIASLVRAGAACNSDNDVSLHQNSPLHWACSVRRWHAVSVLLKAGAGVNSVDKDGCTALHKLVCSPRPNYSTHRRDPVGEILGKLIAHGADILKRDFRGRTPLHTACAIGSLEGVKALLAAAASAGIGVDQADDGGRTALHVTVASRACSVDVVHALLRAGASVKKLDKQRRTPLLHAIAEFSQCNHNVFATIIMTLVRVGSNAKLKTIVTSKPRAIDTVSSDTSDSLDSETESLWPRGTQCPALRLSKEGLRMLRVAFRLREWEVAMLVRSVAKAQTSGPLPGAAALRMSAVSTRRQVCNRSRLAVMRRIPLNVFRTALEHVVS